MGEVMGEYCDRESLLTFHKNNLKTFYLLYYKKQKESISDKNTYISLPHSILPLSLYISQEEVAYICVIISVV